MAFSRFQTGLLLLVAVFFISFSTSISLISKYERLCQNKKFALIFGSRCDKHIRTVVDCEVSEWSPWKLVGQCQERRQRGITKLSRNGGTACPNLTETATTCSKLLAVFLTASGQK